MDRRDYVADLYLSGVKKREFEDSEHEHMIVSISNQHEDYFFDFEVVEMSVVENALSKGVYIKGSLVVIFWKRHRVMLRNCPLRMHSYQVKALMSQFGRILCEPWRPKCSPHEGVFHAEYFVDMLLSPELQLPKYVPGPCPSNYICIEVFPC